MNTVGDWEVLDAQPDGLYPVTPGVRQPIASKWTS